MRSRLDRQSREATGRCCEALKDCGLAFLGVMEGRRETHSNFQVFVEVVGDNAEELIFLQ